MDLLCNFCLVFAMPLCASVYMCLVVTCWEKGLPLGSRLWCLAVSLLPSLWYPGSGVVLDCIDFWSLHPYLLCLVMPNGDLEGQIFLSHSHTNNELFFLLTIKFHISILKTYITVQ